MIDDATRAYLDAIMDAILIRLTARFDAMLTRMDARFDAIERLIERVNRLEQQ